MLCDGFDIGVLFHMKTLVLFLPHCLITAGINSMWSWPQVDHNSTAILLISIGNQDKFYKGGFVAVGNVHFGCPPNLH